jgi:hypothetical protein
VPTIPPEGPAITAYIESRHRAILPEQRKQP